MVSMALAERMAEDGDWANSLWNVRERLILVAVYGAKDLGRLEGKIAPRSHVLDVYKRVTGRNILTGTSGKGNTPPSWRR